MGEPDNILVFCLAHPNHPSVRVCRRVSHCDLFPFTAGCRIRHTSSSLGSEPTLQTAMTNQATTHQDRFPAIHRAYRRAAKHHVPATAMALCGLCLAGYTIVSASSAAASSTKINMIEISGGLTDPFYAAFKLGAEQAASDLHVNYQYWTFSDPATQPNKTTYSFCIPLSPKSQVLFCSPTISRRQTILS